ncbi:MAG: crossover junction endodeoxyribonuclease RuvC [Candidatus Cloacimonadaceae bacterium]|jgi:crossover junction endodeoxyribonuclease RuvC|nr:crossover junction endodeoxyribonuclease RuvC [Candidatus Cloacimonadota bacterium]MCK9177535.1 crossover junction endodeoxyribonuclease RuvC [Candidatus Cloacimonadota bacterium]MDD3103825.1 crossover junction endodeoxyribonuclease RuvC [Candidatus Cloacimonadota bacterium]MDD3533050.1 crossover junction endodeoxyribonuclease RuvC [Candidatus Cloacimonadota bacterium]MDY0126531.1 crossover junction endodeoxyribonuclease RuvC [Candidatus Cloacimonadaceae bacterium]
MMILGIDPGSRYCGYGLIEYKKSKVLAAGCDLVDLTRQPTLGQRLCQLYESIVELCQEYKPDYAAIETMFFQKHIKSIFILGHARGVILLALAQQGIPIVEYSPREVKKAVVGTGNATKAQVRYMIHQLYPLSEKKLRDDAYDALAIATTHFNRIKWDKSK